VGKAVGHDAKGRQRLASAQSIRLNTTTFFNLYIKHMSRNECVTFHGHEAYTKDALWSQRITNFLQSRGWTPLRISSMQYAGGAAHRLRVKLVGNKIEWIVCFSQPLETEEAVSALTVFAFEPNETATLGEFTAALPGRKSWTVSLVDFPLMVAIPRLPPCLTRLIHDMEVDDVEIAGASGGASGGCEAPADSPFMD